MSFTVVWLPEAEEQLAEVWLGATDRQAVTEAANRIETALRRRPAELGDDLFDTLRTVAFGPLGFEFEVIEPDRRVVVLSVWDTTHGRPEPTGN